MRQILFNIFLWVWCFPQQLLGFILSRKKGVKFKVYKYNDKLLRECKIYIYPSKNGSVSLGSYLLIQKDLFVKSAIDNSNTSERDAYTKALETTIKHEYGHFKQSLILGWLYLLVIGLPSFIWCNCFDLYRLKNDIDYSSFYTEKWANKLGGVE